ncbi:MAG: hypothetical protein ACI4S2_06635 [Lachnospiraceae bacterium]
MNIEISKKNQEITNEWRKSALHKMEHKNWTYVSRECYSILEYFLCCSEYEPANIVENSKKLEIPKRTLQRKLSIFVDYGILENLIQTTSYERNKARKDSYYRVFPPKFEELHKEILGFTYPEYPSYDLKFGKIYKKKAQFYREVNSKNNFMQIDEYAKNAFKYESGASLKSLNFFNESKNNENFEIGASLKSLNFFNSNNFEKFENAFEIGASLKSLNFFMEILENDEILCEIIRNWRIINFMGMSIKTNELLKIAKIFNKNGLFEKFQNWRKIYININSSNLRFDNQKLKISSYNRRFSQGRLATNVQGEATPIISLSSNEILGSIMFQLLSQLSQDESQPIDIKSCSIPENEREVLYAMPHDGHLAVSTWESAKNKVESPDSDPIPESPYQSQYGHSQILRQEARRGTKKENAMNLSGFIKTGLRMAPSAKSENKRHLIVKPKKSRNVDSEVPSKKFIEYWNSLAEENDVLPKCRITWGGKHTKAYTTALKFFSELRTGKLFKSTSSFHFSKAELDKYEFIQKNGYSDDDLFRMIKKVADFYLTEKRTLPTKFDQLIYTEFSITARKEGTGKSAFLDLMQQTEIGSLSFSKFYDSLTEDELSILRHRFKPFYYKLRGIDESSHEITDSEWYQMYSGYKVMENLWKSKYKEVCANSHRFKDVTYLGDFIGFYFDIIDLKHSSIPFSKIFNPKNQYLEEFLNYLETH